MSDTVRHSIGPTILLFSGRYFDFGDPEGSLFDIGDIARGLSHICRFAGQVPSFYSVAEHSVYVSQIVPPEHALAGLLHDAAEAFVGDMAKPLKMLCPDYQAIEKRVEAAVFSRFGVPLPLDPSVKNADVRMLATEQAQLMRNRDDWDCTRGHSVVEGLKIASLTPDAAFNLFIDRFEELTGWTGLARLSLGATTLADEGDCPPHCCCCGPGEPCCDCGQIMPAVDEGERAVLKDVWLDFLDANPDDLTSPEDTPDHALVSLDNFVSLFEEARARTGPASPQAFSAAFRRMDTWDRRDEAVLLLVDYTDGDHAIDDAFIAITMGHNNDHNVGDDEGQGWLFAGWCWSHDHYVQGKGKPIGWMPIPHHLARAAEAAAEAAA